MYKNPVLRKKRNNYSAHQILIHYYPSGVKAKFSDTTMWKKHCRSAGTKNDIIILWYSETCLILSEAILYDTIRHAAFSLLGFCETMTSGKNVGNSVKMAMPSSIEKSLVKERLYSYWKTVCNNTMPSATIIGRIEEDYFLLILSGKSEENFDHNKDWGEHLG